MKTNLPKGGLERQSAGTGIRYFSAVDDVIHQRISKFSKNLTKGVNNYLMSKHA
jgi:hypothetical protein